MRAGVVIPEPVKFAVARPANLLSVENQGHAVVIRATQNNFSAREKAFFIRYLAAEGFIPDHYQWDATLEADSVLGIQWLVDRSLAANALAAHRRRLPRILLVILCSSLFWLALLSLAFLHVFQ
jgi:hypothetical protein